MLILIVAGGPDKGRIYELTDQTEVLLGREGELVQLNDPKASRKHARLWAEGGRWYLEDLGSKHGTYRNHKKVERKTALKDGDYLQVGSTILVLARTNGMAVERATLLGADPVAVGGLTPKTMKLVLGGGAIAAAVLLGVNVATYFKTASGTNHLENQLIALADDTSKNSQLQNDMHTMLADGRRDVSAMNEALALMGPSQDRARRELTRQLDSVLAAVENDEQATALASKFDQVLTAMRQQGGQTAAMADRVLAALSEQPTADQLADRVAARVQPISPDVVADLTAAADRLAQADTIGEQFAELRGLIEKVPGQLAGPVQQVVARIDQLETEGDRGALLAAIDDLRKQLPSDPTGKLDAALARLEDAPTRQELAAIAERVASLPTLGDFEAAERRGADRMTTLTAMLEDRQGLDDIRTQLASVSNKLNALDSEELSQQVTKLSDQLAQRTDTESIETQLADIRETLDAQSSTDAAPALAELKDELGRINTALADRRDAQQVQGQLATIITELKDRPDAGLIKDQLEALAANRPAQDDPILAQVLAAVKERAVTDQRVDALLTKLEATPYENTAIADEIEAAGGKNADTDVILAAITERFDQQQVTTAEQLRVLIREEVGAALENLDVSSDTALADANFDEEINADGLTRTEQAYKLAFETGRKITLGARTIDPQTGAVTEGRTLDPAAAKTAGMGTWREWYLMDDMAHRMRLARQASRVRGTIGDPSVVTLPDATTIYAAPPAGE